MATGNGTQELQKLEAAITGARNVAETPHGPKELALDVQHYTEGLAQRIRVAGRYAREHGQYLDELCQSFADKLTTQSEQFASHLVTAARNHADEQERLMGRSTKE